MNKTKIEWAERTWNPITGCTQISPGCANCYAKRLHKRFGWEWKIKLHPYRLYIPRKTRQPQRIFVCSMSDLFHERVPYWAIQDCYEIMAGAKQHTFLVLTKRPERMDQFPHHFPNVWHGVSIENVEYLSRAVSASCVHGERRFISFEPLLGPIGRVPESDWVIVGGESGPGARPMNPDWVRSIRDQCVKRGIPFFFKQWGGVRPGGKALLDGKEWRQMPDWKGAE